MATTSKKRPRTKAFLGYKPSKLPRSDVLVANYRGLVWPTEALPGKFAYTPCLEKPYDEYKGTCKSVKFAIDRYREHFKTIIFAKPLSVRDAIRVVEDYLSRPITEPYYARIQKHVLYDEGWDEARSHYRCRGDCLSDAKFLERINVNPKNGKLSLICGS
jgi:hypothetical protein